MSYFSIRIDNKDFAEGHTNLRVADRICLSIAEPTVEGWLIWGEEIANVFQARDFKHLRLPQNYFTIEWAKKSIRTHNQGARGKRLLIRILAETCDVVPTCIRLTDCTSGEVKDLVAIVCYFLEQIADAWMWPVISESWHNMPHYITACDRAINIRDHNLCAVVPQKDSTWDFLFSLKSTIDIKRNLVLS